MMFTDDEKSGMKTGINHNGKDRLGASNCTIAQGI